MEGNVVIRQHTAGIIFTRSQALSICWVGDIKFYLFYWVCTQTGWRRDHSNHVITTITIEVAAKLRIPVGQWNCEISRITDKRFYGVTRRIF